MFQREALSTISIWKHRKAMFSRLMIKAGDTNFAPGETVESSNFLKLIGKLRKNKQPAKQTINGITRALSTSSSRLLSETARGYDGGRRKEDKLRDLKKT